MTSQETATIDDRIASSEVTIRKLSDHLAGIDEQLEASGSRSGLDDFESFAATGTIVEATSRADLSADRERTAKALESGRAQLARLRDEKREADRREHQAKIDAMTMADAVEFAAEALGAIDVKQAAAELDQILKSLPDIDLQREKAGAKYSAARDAADKHGLRYHRGADPRTGATYEQVLQAAKDAHQAVNELRYVARDRRAEFDVVKKRVQHELRAAYSHVVRLAVPQAEAAEQHAEAIHRFAKTIGTPSAPPAPPAQPKLELPSADDLRRLDALAKPALALTARKLPDERPNHEFLRRSAPRTARAGGRG